jgi:hypothetical protein
MSTKLLILLSLFSISLAYAHPNHMTFEVVQHEGEQNKIIKAIPDKLNHTTIEEKYGHHSDTEPCKEQTQHKTIPCKRK